MDLKRLKRTYVICILIVVSPGELMSRDTHTPIHPPHPRTVSPRHTVGRHSNSSLGNKARCPSSRCIRWQLKRRSSQYKYVLLLLILIKYSAILIKYPILLFIYFMFPIYYLVYAFKLNYIRRKGRRTFL